MSDAAADNQRSPRLRIEAWIAVSLLVAVAALALRIAVEPTDHGYERYAGIAAEMVRSGDWIAPRHISRGALKLYVDKPPVTMWLIAIPMALADTDHGATHHVPNLVAIALSIVFLRRLGARVFGRSDAGWLAAGLYLSMLLPFALLRDKRIDPLFAAFLIGCFDFLHAALTSGAAGRLRAWLGVALCLAAATLTKGPLAPIFFLAVAIGWAAWARQLRALATREAAIAAALWLALVALWPLAMLHEVGWAAWSARLGERPMISRFAGPLHYLGTLPLRLAPWTLLLPALALALRPLLRSAALRLPFAWFGVLFALLHVTSAKHSRYLLPAFPAIALLGLALFVDAPGGARAVLAPRARQFRDGALALVFALGALAGCAASLAPFFHAASMRVWPALALCGGLAIFGGVTGLRLWRAGSDSLVLLARALVVVLLVEAGYDLLRSGDFLADAAAAHASDAADVFVAGRGSPGLGGAF